MGWVFVARSPVRGPASRRSVQDAKKRENRKEPRSRDATPAVRDRERRERRPRTPPPEADKQAEPPEPDDQEPTGPEGPDASSKSFQRFATAYPARRRPPKGTVEGFASHGAYVIVDGVRSYIPLAAMGDPAPNAARQVLDQGETREFVIDGIDWEREGLDLAMRRLRVRRGQGRPEAEGPAARTSPRRSAAAASGAAARTSSRSTGLSAP